MILGALPPLVQKINQRNLQKPAGSDYSFVSIYSTRVSSFYTLSHSRYLQL